MTLAFWNDEPNPKAFIDVDEYRDAIREYRYERDDEPDRWQQAFEDAIREGRSTE